MRRNKINCQIIFRILRDQKNTSLLSQAVKMAPSAAGEFAFVSLVVWLWTKARSGSGSEGLGRCGRHHRAMQWVLLHCIGTFGCMGHSGGNGALQGAWAHHVPGGCPLKPSAWWLGPCRAPAAASRLAQAGDARFGSPHPRAHPGPPSPVPSLGAGAPAPGTGLSQGQPPPPRQGEQCLQNIFKLALHANNQG